jgi:hypothetical protein
MYYAYLKTAKDIKIKSGKMFSSWMDLMFKIISSG